MCWVISTGTLSTTGASSAASAISASEAPDSGLDLSGTGRAVHALDPVAQGGWRSGARVLDFHISHHRHLPRLGWIPVACDGAPRLLTWTL